MSLWWWWSDSLRWLEINLIGGSETIDHLIRMLIEFARAQGLLLNHWKMASYVKCWFLRAWNHASRWQNLIELKKSAASNLGEQFKRALNIFCFRVYHCSCFILLSSLNSDHIFLFSRQTRQTQAFSHRSLILLNVNHYYSQLVNTVKLKEEQNIHT